MRHTPLLIFLLLIFSCVLDLKEKSQETCDTSFLTQHCQGTVVILPARPVLELRGKQKKGTAGPNHAVILWWAPSWGYRWFHGIQSVKNCSLSEDGTERALDQKSGALFHVVLWREVNLPADLKDKHVTKQQSQYSRLKQYSLHWAKKRF